MNNPLISIIVPVYNVEQCLRQCLDSIIAQTYTDWECILVDDGSIDGSGKICDEYATMDSRFHCFHLLNQGVSHARNYGLEKVNGEWITFIDSDDWVESNLLEIIVNIICKQDTDCVKWGFILESRYDSIKMTISGNQSISDNYINYKLSQDSGYDAYVWNTLYKRILLDGIKFDESISWCEDHIFTTEYYLRCRAIRWLADTPYHHRVNYGDTLSSIVHSDMIVRACDKLASRRLLMVGNHESGKNLVRFYRESTNYKAIYRLYNEKHRFKYRRDFCERLQTAKNNTSLLTSIISYTYNSKVCFIIKDALLQILIRLHVYWVLFKSKRGKTIKEKKQ